MYQINAYDTFFIDTLLYRHTVWFWYRSGGVGGSQDENDEEEM